MMHKDQSYEIALRYHRKLPLRVADHLVRRGIPVTLLHRHLLGWNGKWVTIPVKDRNGRIVLMRLARTPDSEGVGPEVFSPPGVQDELFEWEALERASAFVLLVEHELDCLVLEAQGFRAVAWTGGLGTFPADMAQHFSTLRQVYAVTPTSGGGRELRRLAGILPQLRVVRLPVLGHAYGGASDFFIKDHHTADEFRALLDQAQPWTAGTADPEDQPSFSGLIGRYLPLAPRGKHLAAPCPFHPDRKRSFAVFERTGTFHCFGCGAHGDAIRFLMRQTHCTFLEATRIIDQYRALYGGEAS